MTADYYVRDVLKKTAATTVLRKKENGPPTKVKLLPDMSRAIFRQDGAPAHLAKKTQVWCLPIFQASGRQGRCQTTVWTCHRLKVSGRSSRKSSARAAARKLREDPVPDRANDMVEYQVRYSRQLDILHAFLNLVISLDLIVNLTSNMAIL